MCPTFFVALAFVAALALTLAAGVLAVTAYDLWTSH